MKKFSLFLPVFLFFCPPLSAEPRQPLTLKDCYQLALRQSERIAISLEQIKEAEGVFWQSLGTALPQVSYSYSIQHQDVGDPSSLRKETPEGKFVISQTLFQGFREFAAIAGSRSQKKQFKHQLDYAKLLLFRDVADAFYFYLSYQRDIEVLEGIIHVLEDRTTELRKREELGRSRASDMTSVESQLRRLEAEIELIKSQKFVAQQLLEFLTGVEIESLVDDISIERALSPLETYLPLAESRPDVLAQKAAWEVSKKEVAIARSGYFPTVSLDGNYYTKRVGTSEDVDWDATLGVDVPLFEGTSTFGEVKSAKSVSRQEELLFDETQRLAIQDIKNSYTLFQSAILRYDALSKALDATQRNYDLQLQDFGVNLVNNLDVLDALEDLQDSRRDFIAIQNELKQLYWRFQTATGIIPYDDI